jgi:hypothetical protein
VALAGEREYCAVMNEPVDDGRCRHLVGEDLCPFLEGAADARLGAFEWINQTTRTPRIAAVAAAATSTERRMVITPAPS